MFEKYVKLLKSGNISKVYNGPAGYSYLDTNLLSLGGIDNVIQIEFKYFYQSLIVKLFQMGGIDLSGDRYLLEYMSDVESFLNNADRLMEKDYDLYLDQRTYSQRFYGELLRKSPTQIKNLTILVHVMFDDLLERNKNIIEIDTNVIYHTGKLDVSWIPVEYSKEVFKYFFPLSKKRSILIDKNNNVKIRGTVQSTEHEIYIPFIMSKAREGKIDDIIR